MTNINDLLNGTVQLFNFTMVSKRTGKGYPMAMYGTDREDARKQLIEVNFQNANWNRWTLRDK